MLYLVKSLKWTKHYKKDTYWGTNQCGYVTVIANAGFYEEEEAQNILRLSSGNVELIPVTKEILDKAHRQLREKRKTLMEDREKEDKRHNVILADLDERDTANNNSFDFLNQLAEQLGS